jgi:trimethylamine--corrinoid protein Co-methyltransferase
MEAQRPTLRVLSTEVIERIVDEAMTILEKTGITVEEDDTLDILGQMGADIDTGKRHAKLKRKMVESAVKSAARKLVLHDFEGNEVFTFGDGHIHFNPGSAAIFIYDAKSATMRKPAVTDAARFSKLVATLENLEATSTGVVPGDVPENISDSIRLYISCLLSPKPVVTGTFSEASFSVMRDLLLARTGKESLRDAACAIFDVCPSSPLRWSALGCHDLRMCAQNAIPAELISMPLAGALGPMSLLGSVVQHAVETLSGIVIHQAWTPGSPIIYGGSPALFDMRHSTSPMGAVETLLIDLADTEVGKHLGLPTQAYLGMSDAKTVDAQTGLETAASVMMASTGAVDFVSGPGMLNFESCQCLEKLVLDNDICGMARRFARGMEPRGKTLGVDAIAAGLAEGNFLTTEDTLCLYREEGYYPSNIIDRKAHKEEGRIDDRRLLAEAGRQIEERLESYCRPKIDKARIDDLRSVMASALEPYGIVDLADKCLDL